MKSKYLNLRSPNTLETEKEREVGALWKNTREVVPFNRMSF